MTTKLTAKEEFLIKFLETRSYYITSQVFSKSYAQIKVIIKKFNATKPDKVFQYCDHEFEYVQVIHKKGLTTNGQCRLCGMQTEGDPEYLIKNHPNCLIVKKTISDCQEKGCAFCQ